MDKEHRGCYRRVARASCWRRVARCGWVRAASAATGSQKKNDKPRYAYPHKPTGNWGRDVHDAPFAYNN